MLCIAWVLMTPSDYLWLPIAMLHRPIAMLTLPMSSSNPPLTQPPSCASPLIGFLLLWFILSHSDSPQVTRSLLTSSSSWSPQPCFSCQILSHVSPCTTMLTLVTVGPHVERWSHMSPLSTSNCSPPCPWFGAARLVWSCSILQKIQYHQPWCLDLEVTLPKSQSNQSEGHSILVHSAGLFR